MGKTALVTGASGFIGSHLVERLVRDGHAVRAFVRYNGRDDRGHLDRLPMGIRREVEVVRGDLKDPEAIRRAVQGREWVFHLGALIAIPYSYQNPLDVVQTNVVGTAHVLDACRANPALERVVPTSTSEVYGTAQYVPIDEAHPLRGQSPYAASKIGSDALGESYHRSFGLPVAILLATHPRRYLCRRAANHDTGRCQSLKGYVQNSLPHTHAATTCCFTITAALQRSTIVPGSQSLLTPSYPTVRFSR